MLQLAKPPPVALISYVGVSVQVPADLLVIHLLRACPHARGLSLRHTVSLLSLPPSFLKQPSLGGSLAMSVLIKLPGGRATSLCQVPGSLGSPLS